MTLVASDPITERIRSGIMKPRTQWARREVMVKTLRVLADREVRDSRGGATPILARKVGWTKGMPAYWNVIRDLRDDGLVMTVVHGRRTLRIWSLVSHEDLDRAGFERSTNGHAAPEEDGQAPPIQVVEHAPPAPPVLPLPEEPERSTAVSGLQDFDVVTSWVDRGEEGLPPELRIADNAQGLSQTGLIIQAVRLLMLAMTEPRGETFEAVAERLALTLEENLRLRRQNDALAMAKRAIDGEVSALRKASRLAQENLDRMARNAFDHQKYREWRDLDRQMREVPRARG